MSDYFSPFWQAVMGSAMGSVLSMFLAAALIFGLSRRWIVRMVSFSAGLLLAVALLDLLPEAAESGMAMNRMGFWLLVGLLGLYALERTALWRHDHGSEEPFGHHHHGERSVPPALVLLGNTLHNATDGVLLAAAFLSDPVIGWSAAFAVAAHEIPREAGDFVLLLEAGMSRRRALFWSTVSSLVSLAGMLVGWYWLEHGRTWLPVVLTLAAASFIYIAVCDLLPWLKHQHGAFAWQAGFMASGVLVAMAGIAWAH
ncbi:MAG TPA: ZIP family metal transporter [Rhodocyclaceae bacterium]